MGGPRGGQGIGGTVGMTPTSAFPKPYAAPQTLNSDPIQGPGGGPPGLGKVKDKKALADADPLGIDPNVSFDGVGGLDDHINQLKEMVSLPLLYPEVFLQFHVTPPRGVLFHGPPGTGKTLLARALASSVSSQGKKVTFYMRKGADALSKWVGEAEKQLRLLFEEARKNQPSIIFFDEIDGLAPVRSSKQEQIHASIVATLLALMDGMDGRGQVIVIGATNRPDSVDPALRRPGRFDREFYFPLPEQKARRSIIDIHTKGWEPPLKPEFKDQLAELTRGYGGADLRALCTEAALNAVQGTYPQIYSSDKKLLIDPSTIKVLAKDFMISVNKIVPSSERSAASGATPLRKDIEPLLRRPLTEIANMVDQAIPRKRKATALEEAMYDDRDDDTGFERENMQRRFESSRVFRPRLLIRGIQGMGQQYLGAALLSKLEGLHVQNFDMATLMKDSTRVRHLNPNLTDSS
jgi:SpoVK/Ycf46/Vps4 family AAA+-type ATPase